jgi:hypothetical protein
MSAVPRRGSAGLALSAVAIAGGGDRLASDVPPSAVTGAFGGLVYAACAAVFLRRAAAWPCGLSEGGFWDG